MIEIPFHGQTQLVDQIAQDLLGPYPNCWDVVLPPGFGEERFGEQLARRLRADPCRPRVALRAADHSNPNVGAFVRALHWQWLETPKPPKVLDRAADLYLDILLADLHRDGRPVILVLKRFHHVLDDLGRWLLGRLRQEEQAHRLNTVVLTPLPLGELKKRWECRRHHPSPSDYGDSRHTTATAVPPTAEEVMRVCEDLEVHAGVANFIRKLTGGYPEHLAAVLAWWVKHDRPDLEPRTQARMVELAEGQLGTFVEWLDPLEDGRYRDRVIDLYHGVDGDDARDVLSGHPWKDIVLDEDGLRAEALGAAALQTALKEGASRKTISSLWYDAAERARRLYERRQYGAALRALNGSDVRLREPDRLLMVHARLMCAISGGEGDEIFGEDTDCPRLSKALRSAHELLNGSIILGELDRQKIAGRYHQLEEIAAALASVRSVDGRLRNRVVDILAGFAGSSHCNARLAALLVLIKFEAGRALAGDASACQFTLTLPEQIFRIWALWGLKLNYYDPPGMDDPAWVAVRREWPSGHGPLDPPDRGRELRFPVFAFLALGRWEAQDPASRPAAPEASFKELQRALTAHERVRNPHSHGLCLTGKRDRDEYFRLIERWLTYLLAVCPNPVTREELLALIEPLPLISPNGTVLW